MMTRSVLSLLVIALAIGMFITASPRALAGGQSNYIYVYPNNAVRVLVNGTYASKRPLGTGVTYLALTLYPNYTTLSLRHAGTLPAINASQAEGFGGLEGGLETYNLSGSLYVSGYANSTSNGRLETSDLRLDMIYSNESDKASLNLSEVSSIQAITSPAEYEISVELNVSAFPSIPSNFAEFSSELPVSNLGYGVTVKEFKVYTNSTFVSLNLLLIVNGTPAPPNTTLGLIQALLNAELMPGFLKDYYQLVTNFGSRNASLTIFVNTSNSELRNLAEAVRSVLSALNVSLQPMPAPRFYVLPSNMNLTVVQELLNSSQQIATYVESNFRVLEPSTMYVNVSASNATVRYSVESALFEKVGATSPKQSLAAITYLVGNASRILEDNGLGGLAKAVSSLDSVEVTLVGVDGVKVSPSVTSIGNLTSVTVTVSGSSTVTKTAEAVGGITAVAIVLAAVLILLRRH